MKKFLGVIFISFLLCTNIYANPKESIKKEDLLKNAPDKNSDYFKVPKFIKK